VQEPWRFPDRQTPIGKMISAYLTNATAMDDQALHLLFSANRWEKASTMRHLLENGTTVVVDRYAFSGVAYTAAKGYDVDWCKQCDRGLPAPDAVLFLEVPYAIASTRGTFGQEKYENERMQHRVHEMFQKVDGSDRWHYVDGVGTKEEVHKKCMEVVESTVSKVEAGVGLKQLWDEFY